MLFHVFENLTKRMKLVLENEGKHIEYTLYTEKICFLFSLKYNIDYKLAIKSKRVIAKIS